jgi:hypothetical protein
VGRRAWLFEVREFLLRRRWRGGRRHSPDISLLDFWGAPQDNTMEVVSLETWIQAPSQGVARALSNCSFEAKAAAPFSAHFPNSASAIRQTDQLAGAMSAREKRPIAQETAGQ